MLHVHVHTPFCLSSQGLQCPLMIKTSRTGEGFAVISLIQSDRTFRTFTSDWLVWRERFVKMQPSEKSQNIHQSQRVQRTVSEYEEGLIISVCRGDNGWEVNDECTMMEVEKETKSIFRSLVMLCNYHVTK